MTEKRFSKEYGTYQEWSAQAPKTSYAKGIMRLHALHPTASLRQLRRHPGAKERSIGILKPQTIYRLPVSTLTPREREGREKSLKVLTSMRRHGYSLTRASKEIGISPSTVKRYTNGVKKKGHRWHPKRYDRIPRTLNINENGSEVWIEVNDSRHASIIGRYQSAVREFLETGNASVLRPFKGKRVRDAQGNWHVLETDPDAIYEISERRPDEEYYSIYKW